MLGDSVVAAVVVGTRPRAMPMAKITTRKSCHGFPFLSYMVYEASCSVFIQCNPYGYDDCKDLQELASSFGATVRHRSAHRCVYFLSLCCCSPLQKKT